MEGCAAVGGFLNALNNGIAALAIEPTAVMAGMIAGKRAIALYFRGSKFFMVLEPEPKYLFGFACLRL